MAAHAPVDKHTQEPAPPPPFGDPAPGMPSANRAAHFCALDRAGGNPQKRGASARSNASLTSDLGGYISSSRMQASSRTRFAYGVVEVWEVNSSGLLGPVCLAWPASAQVPMAADDGRQGGSDREGEGVGTVVENIRYVRGLIGVSCSESVSEEMELAEVEEV
ncbi:hypothetical protein HOY80DRAFT_1058302 [Tuber brumale]|nr:hypothetical protein HOY80DRAFT_1058302 [Tuber brumale]